MTRDAVRNDERRVMRWSVVGFGGAVGLTPLLCYSRHTGEAVGRTRFVVLSLFYLGSPPCVCSGVSGCVR